MEKRSARGKNFRTAILLTGVFLSMVGLSFAAVPLYDVFCRVTGFGGTTQISDRSDLSSGSGSIVRVRFDGNVAAGLDWSFRPQRVEVRVSTGEVHEAIFLAENLSTRKSSGIATFHVTPSRAGSYFHKIECFCFTEQHLAAGARVEMKVVFFVDPSFLTDWVAEEGELETITLSYSFFPHSGESN